MICHLGCLSVQAFATQIEFEIASPKLKATRID